MWDRGNYTFPCGIVSKAYHLKLCNGVCSRISVCWTDGEAQVNKEISQICKNCSAFKFTKMIKAIGYIILMVMIVLLMLIMCTPEGAIRRHLFVTEGINNAKTAEITKIREERWCGKSQYQVRINDNEKKWIIFHSTHTYYAYPENE